MQGNKTGNLVLQKNRSLDSTLNPLTASFVSRKGFRNLLGNSGGNESSSLLRWLRGASTGVQNDAVRLAQLLHGWTKKETHQNPKINLTHGVTHWTHVEQGHVNLTREVSEAISKKRE